MRRLRPLCLVRVRRVAENPDAVVARLRREIAEQVARLRQQLAQLAGRQVIEEAEEGVGQQHEADEVVRAHRAGEAEEPHAFRQVDLQPAEDQRQQQQRLQSSARRADTSCTGIGGSSRLPLARACSAGDPQRAVARGGEQREDHGEQAEAVAQQPAVVAQDVDAGRGVARLIDQAAARIAQQLARGNHAGGGHQLRRHARRT